MELNGEKKIIRLVRKERMGRKSAQKATTVHLLKPYGKTGVVSLKERLVCPSSAGRGNRVGLVKGASL